MVATLTVPALAVTEAEVEAQVAAEGKAAVAGNVLIWFLCAVAFLKVSQKIDSFISSLGINVGQTGGSMLGDLLIATKGISAITGSAGHALGNLGQHNSHSTSAVSTSQFFKGGLAGIVIRKVTSSAVRTATSNTSAVSTITSASTVKTATAAYSAKESQIASKSSSFTSKTVHTPPAAARTATHPPIQRPSIGGALFTKSLASGGSFANDVIGTVARGDIHSTGMITGETASQALSSYMGFTALGPQAQNLPAYSGVEIGGGRITGIETAPGSSEGVAFGMYLADQYTAPQGEHTTVYSADGAKWYKQYAQNVVERKPYTAPDQTVAYNESIIKKLPDPPKRKDRL